MNSPPGFPPNFHDIFVACWRAANRAAYSVLRNRELAENVAAEACFRILIADPPKWAWSQPENLPRYVAWKAKKLALDELRKIRVRGEEDIQDLAVAAPAEDPDRQTDQRHAVWDCVDQLDPESRKIVILLVVEGFKLRELAETMDATISRIAARKYKALAALRDCIGRVQAVGAP